MSVRRGMNMRRIAIAVAAGAFAASAAGAQRPTENPRPTAAPSLDDTAALGDFLDGAMRPLIDQLHVSGAVVAVVKDGKVLYAQGYGHSDIAKGTPVNPATSLFRIGSTSKLFTWTAVMQLVEQGKLDLDADVNTYLKDFKIPNTYAKPVTLRNLLTHNAGFEDGALGYLILDDSTRVLPID